MPTQPPTWSRLKPHLQRLDKDALLALRRELHAQNADNKVFLSARFLTATPEALAVPAATVSVMCSPSRARFDLTTVLPRPILICVT